MHSIQQLSEASALYTLSMAWTSKLGVAVRASMNIVTNILFLELATHMVPCAQLLLALGHGLGARLLLY